MLLRLRIHTAHSRDRWNIRPDAVRAFAYTVLSLGDEALAAQVHERDGPKPFAIWVESREEGLRVELATLSEAASRAALKASEILLHRRELTYGERDSAVRIQDCFVAESMPYRQMNERFPHTAHIRLRFDSRTAFSQGGRRYLPLPIPELLVNSWASRWNAFAPTALAFSETTLRTLRANVVLSSAEITTERVAVLSSRIPGFTGRIGLTLSSNGEVGGEQTTVQSAFAALAGYARFAGTGVRTTQGMGQTRLIEVGEPGDVSGSDRSRPSSIPPR
jgi:hypothetical protein